MSKIKGFRIYLPAKVRAHVSLVSGCASLLFGILYPNLVGASLDGVVLINIYFGLLGIWHLRRAIRFLKIDPTFPSLGISLGGLVCTGLGMFAFDSGALVLTGVIFALLSFGLKSPFKGANQTKVLAQERKIEDQAVSDGYGPWGAFHSSGNDL